MIYIRLSSYRDKKLKGVIPILGEFQAYKITASYFIISNYFIKHNLNREFKKNKKIKK